MTTVSQFLDQTAAMLHSYTGVLEATTYLTSGINASVTVVPVAHPTYINRGLIEIDDELMHVDAVGDTSVTLMPFGRGAQNTTAATHATNAKVINDPMVPRTRIFEALKRCIENVQLDLYRVLTTTFTFSPTKTTYEVPAGTVRILAVQYEVVGPSAEWYPILGWDLDQNAATASGKAVVLRDRIQPGRTVQIVYAAELPVPSATSTDLETSGIPSWMHPALLYGTCWEILQFMEPARLQLRSVEQQSRAQGIDPGDAGNVAKQVYAMYQLRLDQAVRRLHQTHPTPKHYVR